MRFVAFLLAALVLSSPCLAAAPPLPGPPITAPPPPAVLVIGATILPHPAYSDLYTIRVEVAYCSFGVVAPFLGAQIDDLASAASGMSVPPDTCGIVYVTIMVANGAFDAQGHYIQGYMTEGFNPIVARDVPGYWCADLEYYPQ